MSISKPIGDASGPCLSSRGGHSDLTHHVAGSLKGDSTMALIIHAYEPIHTDAFAFGIVLLALLLWYVVIVVRLLIVVSRQLSW